METFPELLISRNMIFVQHTNNITAFSFFLPLFGKNKPQSMYTWCVEQKKLVVIFTFTVHLQAQWVVHCLEFSDYSAVLSLLIKYRPTCSMCCQSRDCAPVRWWRHVESESEWPWGWRGEHQALGTRWSLCHSLCGASSATSHWKTT